MVFPGTWRWTDTLTSSIMGRLPVRADGGVRILASRRLKASTESATRVWLILWKAAHAIERNALRSVSALGLGTSDFAVLEVLLHKGPLPVNVIGRKVLLTSGSITTAVDRLESKKLLRRTADTSDRRSRIVALTERGRHLIEHAFQTHAKDMEETMSVLKFGERNELIRVLKKVGMWAASRLDDKQ